MNIFKTVSAFLALTVLLPACSETEQTGPSNVGVIGSYRIDYDGLSNRYEIVPVDTFSGEELSSSLNALTIGDNTTGTLGCAIQDTSLPASDPNHCMGLVDPDNCSVEYSEITGTLSFYAKLTHKGDLTGGQYVFDEVNYPRDQEFLNPFYFFLTGILPVSGAPTDLVRTVNTNLTGAECGADGLSLLDTNDDSNIDGRFDCIYPELSANTHELSKSDYPGWDFSEYTVNGALTQGDTTDCSIFMQFTLKDGIPESERNFRMYFDVVAVWDDGTQPDPPEVTSPTSGTFTNQNPITVEGTNVGSSCEDGATVHVDGAASPASTTCNTNGTFSVSVTLNTNTLNSLNVYQVRGSSQSGSTLVQVTHDNTAPFVVGSNPADGQTSVNENTNCVLTFSEIMDTTSFSTANFVITRVSNGIDEAGTISFSDNDTKSIFTPSSKPLVNNEEYDCSVTTAVTDRAGNALSSAFNARFEIAVGGQWGDDDNPPSVRSILPADNTTVSPSTTFTIYFSEAIDPDTLYDSVTHVPIVDANCSSAVPNVAVFERGGSGCFATPQPVSGTATLDGLQKRLIFTPNSTPLTASQCYGFLLSSCVTDIGGNALASRGSTTIDAYSTTVDYNTYSAFFTGSADTDNPFVVHIGPNQNAAGVHERVYPITIFNEPIDPTTIVADYFYLTEFGDPTHFPATVNGDPTSQVVWLKPTSAISLSTNYLMTATGAVSDFAGNQMTNPQTSQFTVGGTADGTAPTVVAVNPPDEADVSQCITIDIWFSEPMDESTLTAANIELRHSSGVNRPYAVNVSDDGMHVELIPDSSLYSIYIGQWVIQNDYTINISTDVTDRAGNALAIAFSSDFEVFRETDAPSVAAVVPSNGGSMSQNGSALVFFSEPMDKTTLTTNPLRLAITGCTPIVSVPTDGTYAILNCPGDLTTGAKTLTVDRDVRDYYNQTVQASCEAGVGNRMTQAFTSGFTVSSGQDSSAPTITNVTPADGATSQAVGTSPTVTFNEPIDPRSIQDTSLFIVDQQGNLLNSVLTISSDAQTVTLNPSFDLSSPGIYYIIGTTAITDLGGGNNYQGEVGTPSVLRSCFSTDTTSCP